MISTGATFSKIAIGFALVLGATAASAEINIQSAQYKEEKGVVYIKGTASDLPNDELHIRDGMTGMFLGSVTVKKNQFKADLPVDSARTPCMIMVQSVDRSRRGRGSSEFSFSEVRHAPENCSQR